MISKEEAQHIAKLARLGLSDKEIEKYQRELSDILDYVEKLKEVDISQIEPTSHSSLVESVMRKDLPGEKDKARGEKLLKLAPETKNNRIKVKSVF